MTHLLDLPRPLVMAHRGDAVHAPENTFAAFGLALERGAQLLETDLWFTKDGVLVCHHDRTLDRTTDSTGAIPEMPLTQTQYEERESFLSDLMALQAEFAQVLGAVIHARQKMGMEVYHSNPSGEKKRLRGPGEALIESVTR